MDLPQNYCNLLDKILLLTDALREDAGTPGPVGLAVSVLAADQLVAGAAGVGDAAAEGLALAVHVTVRDLLGLAAPDRCKTRIKSIGLLEESTQF